jgi:MFS-type transporter involved in bile tolerance (Atg22 family)
LANVAFYVQSVGEIGILAVIVGIMFGVDVNASTANNNWGLSVLIAFASGVWLIFSLPWFFLEKRRPGQDPGRRNIALAGLSRLSYTMRQVFQLKQALLYLVGGCNINGFPCLNCKLTSLLRLLLVGRFSEHDCYCDFHSAK